MGRTPGIYQHDDYTKPTKQMYMMVTKDEYELPLAFADTPAELARMLGLQSGSVIQSAIQKSKVRKPKKRKEAASSQYVKVVFDDDDWEGEFENENNIEEKGKADI